MTATMSSDTTESSPTILTSTVKKVQPVDNMIAHNDKHHHHQLNKNNPTEESNAENEQDGDDHSEQQGFEIVTHDDNLIQRKVSNQSDETTSSSVFGDADSVVVGDNDNICNNAVVEGLWPLPCDDEMAIRKKALSPLPKDNDNDGSHEAITREVTQSGKFLIRSITWNQHANTPPSVPDLREHLFLESYFHIIAIGTQECENTFQKSLLNPSKEKWENLCQEALGESYTLIRAHALQASHLALYVHKAIVHLITDVNSHAIGTGIYDTLGNKGGIGMTMTIGHSKLCFLTAHLAPHQHQMTKRVTEFEKISKEIASVLGPQQKQQLDKSSKSSRSVRFIDRVLTSSSSHTTDPCSDDDDGSTQCCEQQHNSNREIHSSDNQKNVGGGGSGSGGGMKNPLVDAFDFVFFGGDFNFRIHGTRPIVDLLLANNRNDVLVDNDQLSMLLNFEEIFSGLTEGALTFRPTYSFDVGTDNYDTSEKKRVPSWTDRILFKPNPSLDLISYSSAMQLRTSDHRPVYATFRCSLDLDEKNIKQRNLLVDSCEWKGESKSEVCVIS